MGRQRRSGSLPSDALNAVISKLATYDVQTTPSTEQSLGDGGDDLSCEAAAVSNGRRFTTAREYRN